MTTTLPPPSVVVPPTSAPRLLPAVTAYGAAVALFAVLVGLHLIGQGTALYVDDIGTALAALAAAVACFRAGRRHTLMSRFWFLLAAACAAWALGEVIWATYELVLQEPVPTPSWADIGYLAAPVLAFAAFLSHPAARRRQQSRAVAALDGLAIATALLSVSWTVVLGPLVRQAEGLMLADVVTLSYPFTDVVLVFLVVLAVRGVTAENRPAASFILGGLLVMALTDSAYAYLIEVAEYQSGELLDTGWFAAYLAIALGALYYRSALTTETRETSLSPRVSVVASYVPVLLGLGVIGVVASRGGRIDAVGWSIALGLTVLVLARQALYLAQRRGRRAMAADEGPPRSRKDAPPGYGGTGEGVPSARPSGTVTTRARPAAQSTAGVSPGELSAEREREFRQLTLQMAAIASPTAPEIERRTTGRLTLTLMTVASALALYDLSVLGLNLGR